MSRANDDASTLRFHELVRPHIATVLRVAQLLAGRDVDAEDLAQETMLKALRSIGTLRDGADVRAWLLTILRNTRTDRLRRAAASAGTVSLDQLDTEPQHGRDDDPPTSAEPWERPEEILDAFSDAQVIAALQELPEEIRLTLLLVDVEQMGYRDAAAVLGVPVGTIKSRAHRGRAMLRRTLWPVAREMGLLPRE